MYSSIGKMMKSSRGFTLVELSISLLVFGLLLAPGLALYHNYKVDKDFQTTEDNIEAALDEIGIYRSVFGRYPCPADPNVGLGDATYGLEETTCVDSIGVFSNGVCSDGADGVCATDSELPGRLVLVGSLPFKVINTTEPASYDQGQGRLTYAVTADLTKNTTFDASAGGISIVDKNNDTMVTPAGTAHFIVMSHGANKHGAVSKEGTTIGLCTDAPALEQENCDGDSTFRVGEIDSDFDDRVGYFSGVMPEEWQISEVDDTEIMLKNLRHMSLGSDTTTNLDDTEQVTVYESATDDGTLKTSRVIIPSTGLPDPTSGLVFAENLCEEDGIAQQDCFAPRLWAGQLNFDGTSYEAETTAGAGMSCYKPSTSFNGYLVGFEDGQPICSEEIYLSCPEGSFITGIDPDGKVICNAAPEARCMDENVTAYCGETRQLLETYSGGNTSVYSGECQEITDYDAAWWTTELAGLTFTQAQTEVSNVNAEARTTVACGTTAAEAQIRHTFVCDAGTWVDTMAHERHHPWSTFPSDPLTSSSPWPAENTYVGTDPNNTNHEHDCWCREDYRVVEEACDGGLTGTQYRVDKHSCPQTSHQWQEVTTVDDQCTCAPSTTQEPQSCNSYYDEINPSYVTPTGPQSPTNGLTGNVIKHYNIICVGGVPQQESTPYHIDTSGCACQTPEHYDQDTPCPSGTGNSFTGPHGPKEDVQTIMESDRVCPGTQTGGMPDPAYVTAQQPWMGPPPACTCEIQTDYENVPCEEPLQGTLTYVKYSICSGGPTPPIIWEDESVWKVPSRIVAGECKSCDWVGVGPPVSEEVPYGAEVGSSCNCQNPGAMPLCWSYGSPYDVHPGGCNCVVQ